MSTKHKATHLKAALILASKDKERPNLCQVSVSASRIESTNGHAALRIERAAHEDDSYVGEVDRSALQNVLRAQGVHGVVFREENDDMAEFITAEDEDGGELVRAEPVPVNGFPNIDELGIFEMGTAHRLVRLDPGLFIDALRAVKASGIGIGVTMRIPENPRDPVIFVGEDDNGAVVTVVVMPMSVPELAEAVS